MDPNEPGTFGRGRYSSSAPKVQVSRASDRAQSGQTSSSGAAQDGQNGSNDHQARAVSHQQDRLPVPPRAYPDRSLDEATKAAAEARRSRPPVTINAAYARADAAKYPPVNPRQHGSARPSKRGAEGSPSDSERRARPREGPSLPSRHVSSSGSQDAGGVDALYYGNTDNASTSDVNWKRAPSIALNPYGRPSPPPEAYRGRETPGASILVLPPVPALPKGARNSSEGNRASDPSTAPAPMGREGATVNVASDARRPALQVQTGTATGGPSTGQRRADLSVPADATSPPVVPTPAATRERSPAAVHVPVSAPRVPQHGVAPVSQPANTSPAPVLHRALAQQTVPVALPASDPPGSVDRYLCTVCGPGSSPAFKYPEALNHVLNQHHMPLVNALHDQALSELREVSGTTETLLQCLRCGQAYGAGPSQMGTAIGHVTERHLSRIRNGMIAQANGCMQRVGVPGAPQQ